MYISTGTIRNAISLTIMGSSKYKDWSKTFQMVNVYARMLDAGFVAQYSRNSSRKIVENKEFNLTIFHESFMGVHALHKKYNWESNEPLEFQVQITLLPHPPKNPAKQMQSLNRTMNGIHLLQTEVESPSNLSLDSLTDFSIHCKNGSILRVHRFILELRSPAIQKALENERNSGRNKEIKFVDMQERSIKEMIRYLYTNTIGDIHGIEEELIKIGNKLEIEGLEDACMEQMEKKLITENAIETLILARQQRNDKLVSKAISCIRQNFKDVKISSSWNLMLEHPDLLMEIISSAETLL